VNWVQPQSSIWSDGSCHEIRFNLPVCTGARALGDKRQATETCHYYSVLPTTGGQCSGQQRNWARVLAPVLALVGAQAVRPIRG
jgi:hypothetical protein